MTLHPETRSQDAAGPRTSRGLAIAAAALLLLLASPAAAQDADGDGVLDAFDNCSATANADQLDGDADGFGNVCDGDLDQDLATGPSDFFAVFRPCIGSDVASAPQCAAADFDGNGLVGPSDFFGFFRPLLGTAPGPGAVGGNPVTVSFGDVRSRVEEGGSIEVPILLDTPAGATLSLRVSGSAGTDDVMLGASCQDLGGGEQRCTLAASGATTLLSIQAIDDRDPDGAPEATERLSLELEATPGVMLGALSRHVVVVENNDAVWDGIFSAEGEEIPFALEIQREGALATATLVSDGIGPVPAGRTPLGTIDFDLAAGSFQVALPAFELEGGTRLLGTPAHLALDLDADDQTGAVGPTRIEGDRARGSATTAHFLHSSAPHFDRSVPGSFVLNRRPTAVSE